MNVNKAILVGRVTKDPEVRTTQSGQVVASFSMATNQFWTGKYAQKKETTEFHNIVIWGRLAEIARQYLVKGQECFIEGRIQTREYESKDGIKRRITEIVGEVLQLGSRPKGSEGNYKPATPATAAPSAQPAPAEELPTINLDDDKEEIKIDDVPF